ncbi:MAG: SH3 domain-containing protein [Desulfobacterales bacterium]
MRSRLLLILLWLLAWPATQSFAGIDTRLDEQLNILAQGGVPKRLIPGAEYRVAVITYEDPDGTGLGDTVAALVAREVLTNSGVSSIGVIFFREGVAPTGGSNLGYFDKVERVTAAQGVKLALWGVIRKVGKGVEISTYAQVPRPALEQHFTWRLRLPAAMGGRELLARLRPDRILVQRLQLDAAAFADLRRAAETIGQLRKNPRIDDPVTSSLPMDEIYYITKREGDWVRLATKSGIDGWAPTRGHCAGPCGELLQAAAYSGGVLRYMASGRIPDAGEALTEEARAVSDQLDALNLLQDGTMDKLFHIEAITRRWQEGPGVPPGGGAFANIQALSRLSIALKEQFMSRGGRGASGAELATIYDQITLDKRGAQRQAFELAKVSLTDPRNPDLLHNLAVLFEYAGDKQRAALAQGLANEATPD